MEIVKQLCSAATVDDFSNYIELAKHELAQTKAQSKILLHSHLCRVLAQLKSEKSAIFAIDGPQTAILHSFGPSKALEVIGTNLPNSR